jgi:tetratricopeptide (TPR) repeat protein
MSPEALEAIFVQREDLAARLVELVRESVLTPAKHHSLLIGPRGIGKTHLVSLVYHRVQAMEDLRGRLVTAWMREEEWGVDSFLDLLVRILRALQEDETGTRLSERVERLYQMPVEHAEHAAAQILEETVGDRTLWMIVETLGDLFNGLKEMGQQQLRAFMQENPFFTVLATAQSLFDGVSDQNFPFYGTFSISHLEKLSTDDASRMLSKIAEYQEDRELATFIHTPLGRSRIRAVGHLAGGNHRVYAVLSHFLTRKSLDELVEPFMGMIDDLTPYYQSRMADLPPQQRKMLEYLCERRCAVQVKEIAQQCFLSPQVASNQLKLLREKGYVDAAAEGRESYYELREPLMRICIEVKKQRGGPIRLFVDFLRLWYTREELEQRLVKLEPTALFEKEYISQALGECGASDEDPRIQLCMSDYRKHHRNGNFRQALCAAEEIVAIRGNSEDWRRKGLCFLEMRRFPEALECFDEALSRDENDYWACFERAFVLGTLERYEESSSALEKALEVAPAGKAREAVEAYQTLQEDTKRFPSSQRALRWKVTILEILRYYEDALGIYEKILKADPKDTVTWLRRQKTLFNLGRYKDVLSDSEEAISLHRSCDTDFRNSEIAFFVLKFRGIALLGLNCWEEGLAQLEEAYQRFPASLAPDSEEAKLIVRTLFSGTSIPEDWRPRAQSLFDLFGKHEGLSELGQGVAESIALLKSEMVSDASARKWLETWKSVAGETPVFETPLRLMDAAVRYKEKPDRRILLGLAVEERSILEEILEMGGGKDAS